MGWARMGRGDLKQIFSVIRVRGRICRNKKTGLFSFTAPPLALPPLTHLCTPLHTSSPISPRLHTFGTPTSHPLHTHCTPAKGMTYSFSVGAPTVIPAIAWLSFPSRSADASDAFSSTAKSSPDGRLATCGDGEGRRGGSEMWSGTETPCTSHLSCHTPSVAYHLSAHCPPHTRVPTHPGCPPPVSQEASSRAC